jgi:hypothetical protein
MIKIALSGCANKVVIRIKVGSALGFEVLKIKRAYLNFRYHHPQRFKQKMASAHTSVLLKRANFQRRMMRGGMRLLKT